MLSVNDEYLQAINADVRNMPYRVTLAGAAVLDQTRVPRMTFDEGLSDNSGVSLGTANSATLKLTLRDPEMMDYSGMYVEPESGLTLPNGNVVWIPLGKFWVTGSSTNNDYKTVQLTCADGMYHLTGNYVSQLTYPTTPQNMMYEIASQTGIKFVEPESWPDIKINKKPQDLNLTYRTAIGYIAGCCGKNARFNREGALEFVWYTNVGKTIERRNQYLDGMIRLNDKPLQIKFDVTGEKITYTVTTISDTNGSVIASPNAGVTEGERVNVTVQPLYEYELATITAVTDSGEEVVLVGNAERTEYYFAQPEDNVTITASFRKISGGPYELSVSSQGNGEISYGISANEEGENFFSEGDTVNIFVTPESGYVFDTFTTTPSAVTFEYRGETATGKSNYRFVMPRSDVSIAAYFKADDKYSIERTLGGGAGYIVVENTTTPGTEYHAGDVISVRFARATGYVFSRYESNVSMTQIDSDDFKFVMPSHDVSITAYFEEEIDTSDYEAYSFLQHPDNASPPTTKPYWAVFYKFSEDVGANAKYYLVWFDSWSVTGTSSIDDKTAYTIKMDGYYYCRGRNNGNGSHQWNTDVWSGNGASGSTLDWKALLSRWNDGYCLLASNVALYKSDGTLVFKRCETNIGTTQTDWLVDGVDVREQGALTFYDCPDTYSTPLPSGNWLLLNRAYVYKTDEDGNRTTLFNGTGVYALYTDGISVERVGQHFENVDLTFYKLAFSSATILPYMLGGGFYESAIKTIDETCYILIGDPAYSSEYGIATGGLVENTCGLYGANTATMAFNNNSCIVCDCVAASTFSLLRTSSVADSDTIVIDSSNITAYSSGDTIVISGSGIVASADGDTIILTIDSAPDDPIPAEKVTMTYTNPFINEKMVSAISSRVQSISYTPAKVKHRGNPAFQAGDIVTVPDREGNYHNVLIVQQTMTFGGGMNAEISCPGQTEKTKNFSANSSSNTKVQEAVYKSNAELERKIKADNALIFSALNKSIVAVSQQANSWGAQIESLVEWRGTTNATMAAIQQTASKNSANISLLVENNAVKGSVVIEAINNESVAKISADSLDIVGKKLNIKVDATNIEGTLNANQINAVGLTIGGWKIQENIISDKQGVYVELNGAGTSVASLSSPIGELMDSAITNLVLRVGSISQATCGIGLNGAFYATNAYISGIVKATTGNIGDLLIEDGGLFSAEDADTFAGLKPGLIGMNTPNAWFNADEEGVSAGVTRATGSGANVVQISSTKGELTGDWYFTDSTGRSISLATIITLLQ